MLKPDIRKILRVSGLYHSCDNVAIVAGLPFRSAVFYASAFAVAFLFYSVVWSNAPIPDSDTGTYFKLAQELSNFHITQLHYRTPGYPLLLVLTEAGRSPRILFFVSLVLHFSTVWLLGIVLYQAGLSQMKLMLFSLILLFPPFVEPAGYILSENLTQAMLVTAFVSFIFWRLNKRFTWILISAASIGCAALTRPTYQVLVLAVVGWLVIARFMLPWTAKWTDVAKGSLALILGSIIFVGGYAYFNYRSFGYFGITPVLGFSLSQKTVHVIERLPDEYAAIREILIKTRNAELLLSGGTDVGYIRKAIPELIAKTGMDWARLSNYMLKLNLILIQKAPLTYLLEVVHAFDSYCFPVSRELANFGSRSLQSVWAVLHFVFMGGFAVNLILLVGATAYIKSCGRLMQQRTSVFNGDRNLIHFQAFSYGLAGIIVLYTAAISCVIDAGDPRHRVPTDVLIIFMLFLGNHLWRRMVGSSMIVLERTRVVAGS